MSEMPPAGESWTDLSTSSIPAPKADPKKDTSSDVVLGILFLGQMLYNFEKRHYSLWVYKTPFEFDLTYIS